MEDGQSPRKRKPSLKEGTVVVASDRQYVVTAAGFWKRLRPTTESVLTERSGDKEIPLSKYTPRPLSDCQDGRRLSDGAKCWCNDCLRERRAKNAVKG